jgi:hypothetical protein
MSKPRFYSVVNNDEADLVGAGNASVATFSSDLQSSIAKELTQNSLDARVNKDGALEIKISDKLIPKASIPNFNEFENILSLSEKHNSPKDAKFYSLAKESIKDKNIRVFVFEDFMTKGLEGDDEGNNLPQNSTEPTFQTCVRGEGSSAKDFSNSKGSHGVGKNSVFGASAIRTVFYSSLDRYNNYKFEGVSKLTTYRDDQGIPRKPRTYYGNLQDDHQDITKHKVRLISKPDDIPHAFRRTKPGLSQYVLGALVTEDWKDYFRRSFIENYWWLFEQKTLSVTIDNQIIDNSNYLKVAESLFADAKPDNPLNFIKAYKDYDEFETKKIYKIGEVHFYVREARGDEKYPNKIMFLRDGMLISKNRKLRVALPNAIAGVMFCNNEDGNEILGFMEPPQHNEFLPSFLKIRGPSNLSEKDGDRILKEIRDFQKEVLNKIKNKYSRPLETVDFIDELFSEISALDSKEKSSGSKSLTKDETFNRKYLPKVNLNVMFNSHERNSKITQNSETDLGDGDGPGIGTGTGGSFQRQGEKKGKPKKEVEGGGSSRSRTKTKGKFKHQITSRFFIVNEGNNNKYNLVIKSNNSIPELGIVVSQKGDSDRVKIMSSRLIGVESRGQVFTFLENKNSKGEIISYQINGLNVKEGEPCLVELTLNEKNKSALTIIETK